MQTRAGHLYGHTRGKQYRALISYPSHERLPPMLYEGIKAPPWRSVCPDLDHANLTSLPPDTMLYLNVKTQGWIVGMHQAGLPFQAISNLAEVPLTTVYDTMKKYKRFGTVQTEKKTGLPAIMTA
ncbi:hypothetical protein O181_002493 [Austropuccinia psidii MF-1]|uniref:Helix-turn-helix domain-containing protein n=1 Tax=Austropuccinia psidii MF-1 TaxID=1389203 RepID=A0A9Q3BCU5_9BASI|nr:hypothetical protein [Austropuccinia psidii MF-1]